MDIAKSEICQYGSVSIKERDTVIGRNCGTEGNDVVSWNNSVTLYFYSSRYTGMGFVVNYRAIVYDAIEVSSGK